MMKQQAIHFFEMKSNNSLKVWWGMLKATANEWSDDKASRMGAALAYYSIFSLGPLLFLIVAIAGFFFGEEAARGQLFYELKGMLGATGAKATQDLLASASAQHARGWAALVGGVTLLFTATGVVVQLKDALNTIWEVKIKPGLTVRAFVHEYIISIAAILGIGFLLMISLVLTAAIAAVGKYLAVLLPIPEGALQLINFFMSFGIITMLFAMMFKVLPDVDVLWRDVLVGAVGTALLFTIGKSLIGFYLGKQALDSTYGAAGSLMVILAWVYYSSQIVLFGAEFTRVHALHSGRTPNPNEYATSLDVRDRIQQGIATERDVDSISKK